MQVRLLGFRLEVVKSEKLTLESFAAALAAKPYDPDAPADEHRHFFMNSAHHVDYHVGLVVTMKDSRTYCQLVKDAGSMLVKVSDMALDTNLMDFNFFVVNKKTGAGVYQHYHQSCSINGFGQLAARRFRSYREELIDNEVKKLAPGDATDGKLHKIRKGLRGQLKWEILVRPNRLEELIGELRRVKSFEYSLATPKVEQPEFKPLAQHIKNEKSKISFAVGAPVGTVAKAINSFVGVTPLARGRVEGEDEDGLTRVLRIMDNPENFGEYDFDHLAARINDLDIGKFEEAWVLNELIQSCKDHRHIFEVAMK